jgi:hypothetical protein
MTWDQFASQQLIPAVQHVIADALHKRTEVAAAAAIAARRRTKRLAEHGDKPIL